MSRICLLCILYILLRGLWIFFMHILYIVFHNFMHIAVPSLHLQLNSIVGYRYFFQTNLYQQQIHFNPACCETCLHILRIDVFWKLILHICYNLHMFLFFIISVILHGPNDSNRSIKNVLNNWSRIIYIYISYLI